MNCSVSDVINSHRLKNKKNLRIKRRKLQPKSVIKKKPYF